METAKKFLCVLGALLIASIIALAIVIYVEEHTPAELPCGYEIRTGENKVVRISIFYGDNRTIPVPADEIEISYFILSEDNISISIRDENRNGEWEISRELGISWTSKDFGVGESVILPTGEEVTLLKFNLDGSPVCSVADWK